MTEQQPQPMIVLGPNEVALILRPGEGEIRWGTEPENGQYLPQHAGVLVAISSRLSHDPDFAFDCVRWFLDRCGPEIRQASEIVVADSVK